MSTRYIFITGGVLSSIGKGLIAASIGLLLKEHNLKVTIQKYDPYINVDPGTMDPFQHGEVFVTADGLETDLDIGHYERFLNTPANKYSSVTTGRIYLDVIQKERMRKYNGQTVQIVPHITNRIKAYMYNISKDKDIVICEIGGTVGDIESLPFLEAIRQIRLKLGAGNAICIHVAWLPFLKTSSELKTKPTQHSIATLRNIGIQPDILICRSEDKMPKGLKNKLSIFCNINKDAIFNLPNLDSIYNIPQWLFKEKIDKHIISTFKYTSTINDISTINFISHNNVKGVDKTNIIDIGIVGKYIDLPDAYLSVIEALKISSAHTNILIKYTLISSDNFLNIDQIDKSNCILNKSGYIIPAGFGIRGIEGKINLAHHARINKIPILGICLGMQCMLMEIFRNMLGYPTANSIEFDPDTEHPILIQLPENKIRLGEHKIHLKENTLAFDIYNNNTILERHRHNYHFNNQYIKQLNENNNIVISGHSIYNNEKIVEIIELNNNDYYIATQYHPEFTVSLNTPNPLFTKLIYSAFHYNKNKVNQSNVS